MARSRSTRRLRRFRDVGHARRALLIEALAWLLLTRLALAFVPFPRLARRLGTFVAPNDVRATRTIASGKPSQALIAEQVGWAVTRAARHAPFRAVCLPQAMAARIMLKRRGVSSVLHFGAGCASRTLKPINAHAWLDAAGVEVIGYPEAKNMAAIACFIGPSMADHWTE
ncbi:MAG: hypothetical protein JWO28_2768 [Hyphomicrobiales bacterium]|nr:hypothetical protein [Hyphomicrobiales bacterium]